MSEQNQVMYTKLINLVDEKFTVEIVGTPKYKKWDSTQGKMLVAESQLEGYRKLYPVTTDKGQMDLGSGQLGSLLEAVFDGGKADIVGRTFEVSSNGELGINIRYFFRAVKNEG